ncbi:MAG: PE-PGRS family protein [Actinophytocola sp.]|nr:PE-PGRS family protein [Actinophytocola sp.]
MHKWAKRGIQTALVTGGMFMLGTGIASADENVDPDRPASPIDGGIAVPVDISNNNMGTLTGEQQEAPELQETISTKDVTDPVVDAYEQSDIAKDDPFHGNRVNADLAVPVQMTNNAAGVLGDAETTGGDSTQTYDGTNNISTDGSGAPLAGNVVDLDWAAPVQIANNAGALLGDATTSGNSAQQETTTGGNVETDGSEGTISGNILAGQAATPLQGNNNALSAGGTTESDGNSADSSAHSGGYLETVGSDGVLSGNAGGGPLAAAGGFNNNAGSWIGGAETAGAESSTDATAGGTQTGLNDIDTYIQTDGDGGVGSGNIAQPQGAGNLTGHGIAGTWIGTAAAGSDAKAEGGTSQSTETEAGAFSNTSGEDSVVSGNMADAPVAAPIEVFCSAGSWIGIASSTQCENSNSAEAGSGTYTSGTGSTGGGNSVHAPLASPVEAFGVGGTWIGTAEAEATEDKLVDAGGYNGSTGDDSTVGGNIVQTPVASPGELFGVGGAWGGSGTGTASETKVVNAGGDGNTSDDNGTGSSNVIATPIAQPVQGFGIGGAWIGEGHGQASADNTTTAGGDYTGSGEGGTLSGNVGQIASASPAQAFGIGGVWGGNASGSAEASSSTTAGGTAEGNGSEGVGSGNIANGALATPLQGHGMGASWIGQADGTAFNVTEAAAGGDADTDGTGGSLGGNVVYAPLSGAGTAFGNAASFIGSASGEGANEVVSEAGGDTTTAGDEASGSGNALGVQGLPVAQAFGNAASVVANADGVGTNTTDSTSGGDILTSGESGSLSGNIFDVPAAAVAQVFGNAGTLGGVSHGIGDNTTTGVTGGEATTAGDQNSLSGTNTELPIGGLVQIYNFSAPLLGEALAIGTNVTSINLDTAEPQINLPLNGSEMSIDSVPALNKMAAAPASPLRSERAGLPTDVSPAMMPIAAPAAPGVDMPLPAPGLPTGGVPGAGELPGLDGLSLDGLPGLDGLPVPAGRDLPAAPALPGAGSLPTDVPAAGELPALPTDVDALPELPLSGELPGAGELPGLGGLSLDGLPGLDGLPVPAGRDLPAAPALPGAGSLPTDVPAAGELPALPTDVDALPELPLSGELPALPGVDSLPTQGLPTQGLPMQGLPTGGLPVPAGRDLPAAPALPGAGSLPTDVDALPELPLSGELPISTELSGVDMALPAVDSLPARSETTQTGVKGMFAKFLGMLTGKSIQA